MSLFDNKRHAQYAPKMECPICQKEFTLGVNGTTDGCDGCTGTVRATNGFVIEPECACYEFVGDNPNCKAHGKGDV